MTYVMRAPVGVSRVALLLLLFVLAASAVGCAENAVLEMEIDLPGRGTSDSTHAFVQVRSGEQNFADAWSGDDPLDGFPLQVSANTISFSVVGDSDHEGQPLLMKVRFCTTSRCIAIVDEERLRPKVYIRIERAFYVGHYTGAAATIDAIPDPLMATPMIFIGKCAVRGCIGGTTEDYCRMDGSHFCE